MGSSVSIVDQNYEASTHFPSFLRPQLPTDKAHTDSHKQSTGPSTPESRAEKKEVQNTSEKSASYSEKFASHSETRDLKSKVESHVDEDRGGGDTRLLSTQLS